jgi:hypothetical protein
MTRDILLRPYTKGSTVAERATNMAIERFAYKTRPDFYFEDPFAESMKPFLDEDGRKNINLDEWLNRSKSLPTSTKTTTGRRGIVRRTVVDKSKREDAETNE